jgi:hypothetical protein
LTGFGTHLYLNKKLKTETLGGVSLPVEMLGRPTHSRGRLSLNSKPDPQRSSSKKNTQKFSRPPKKKKQIRERLGPFPAAKT